MSVHGSGYPAVLTCNGYPPSPIRPNLFRFGFFADFLNFYIVCIITTFNSFPSHDLPLLPTSNRSSRMHSPKLTWRDVQHIVVQGSRVPSADVSWTINGAGRHVSHRFGFGLLDCGRMVELAQTWNAVPDQRVCNTTRHSYR